MRNLSIVKKRVILCVVLTVIAVGVFCAIFFPRQDYSLRGASDACFGVGALYLAAYLYALIRRAGVFDIFEYSFYRLGESFKPGIQKRYPTAYDFSAKRMEKRQERKSFLWPYLILAALFLIIAVIFMLVFNANIQK